MVQYLVLEEIVKLVVCLGGTLTKSITINDIKIELYDLEGVSYAEWNNDDIYYSYTASSEENIEEVLKYLVK